MIRSVFLHVVIPGQEPGAKDLPKDFSFPTMHQLGIGLVTILDQLRIARSLIASRNCQKLSSSSVVGLGDGAGANIITRYYHTATESSREKNSRFAMMHPTRVHGIVTVNNTATESLGRFTDRLKVQQLWSISERFISFIGQTQCFEERPEGWSERKASVPMVMDGCQKMQNYYSQECGQFRRSIQEEERVHD